jgi:hypothetical protein
LSFGQFTLHIADDHALARRIAAHGEHAQLTVAAWIFLATGSTRVRRCGQPAQDADGRRYAVLFSENRPAWLPRAKTRHRFSPREC